MNKQATFESVMFAAMSEELAAIHREKLALNLAPVGNFIAGLGSRAAAAAPKAITALEGVGARAVGGLERAGRAGLDAGGIARRAGGGVMQGLGAAEGALGGVKNLNRAAGGAVAGAAGLGALGVAGAARRAVAGPPQTQITVR